MSNTFTKTLLYDIPDIGGGTQGLAIDNLSYEIAQLYTGKIITIKLSDGSYKQRADTRNLGHGGAGRFEFAKKNQSDLYPPLWVATQQNKTVGEDIYGQFIEVFIGEDQSIINRAFLQNYHEVVVHFLLLILIIILLIAQLRPHIMMKQAGAD